MSLSFSSELLCVAVTEFYFSCAEQGHLSIKMGEPLSLMYGIDLQTRCLVGVPAEQERTLFLVGTLSLKQDNQITESSPMGSKGNINAIAWNPHFSGNTLGVACDGDIRAIDMRSLENSFIIKDANPPTVRSMDFNPNMQYTIATCGDDCRVALWDTRRTIEPLKTLHDHSHWIWCVRFNPIHDQLILSGGSDARLFLNSVMSLSSDSIQATDVATEDVITNDSITQRLVPLKCSTEEKQHAFSSLTEEMYKRHCAPSSLVETSSNSQFCTKAFFVGTHHVASHFRLNDERLEKVEEHEDSVYACAWAGNDPWVFASLSFDGRVIVSRVKRHHKYAILQL
uniref:WD_REPEATS_REGION domain-containing protein n=1 Tax=Ascaris lumbricoides TaxID=6252 RepID=A0A0M3HZF7_ASCLU